MIRILGKKKVAKKIFLALSVIIIPSFLIWGVGMELRSSRDTTAARVNRHAITRDAYYKHLNEILDQYRSLMENEPEENSPEMAKIKQAALEDLVREKILDQEISRRRIRVTDQEILAAVKSDPSFKNEQGVFDEKRFQETISRLPEAEWLKIEDSIRQSVRMRKLQNLVTTEAQLKITDQEIQAYRKTQALKPGIPDDLIRQALQAQKSAEFFQKWYQNVRKSARVETLI